MRIDELKKIAEENDYELRSDLWQHSLKRKGCDTYININGKIENRIWVSIVTICDEKDFKMLKAAVEFAETPPEDREEDKKYYLRAMLSGIDEDENYLNLDIHGSGFMLSNNEDTIGYQTEFTKDGIKNLIINWDVDLDDFEIIEVGSDYEAGRQENL